MSVDKNVASQDMADGFEIVTTMLLVFLFVLWAVTILFVTMIFARVDFLRRHVEQLSEETGNLEMIRDSGNGYYAPVKTSIRTALIELIVREQKRSDGMRLLVPQDEQALFSKGEAVTYPDKFVADV